MNDTQQWVYDVVSKMDPGEARMFALLVADDLHDWTAENNKRQLDGVFTRIQKSIDDDLGRHFLRRLRAGDDPEQLVAEAAAVSIAKADFKNDWFMYQERTPGGQFGRMTGAQFKAKRDELRAAGKYEEAKLKAQRRGLNVANTASSGASSMDSHVRNFQDRYHRVNHESGASQTMNRVGATGQAVAALGVVTQNSTAVAAGTLAQVAGHYGPEAEKVIGPSMRKAAYRYRGTERRPDKEIDASIESSAQKVLAREGRKAVPGVKAVDQLTPSEKAYAAHDASVRYMLGFTGKAQIDGKMSPQLRARNSRVPSAQMADLHRQSGKVTPSEGIMIDGDGNVVAQAVGFAEDHYLPFNLKNLGSLKGGSYVRTRESGGLTSEDVYAGLMSGARSMTVVSNSGVFTMHFDDDLRGGRRYNDKAKQMVGRYEKTLDAIKSKQVANPSKKMDSATRAEIRIKVEDDIKAEGLRLPDEEVDRMVKQAEDKFAQRPQLTPSQEAHIERQAKDIESHEGETAARKYRYQARDELLQNIAGQNYRLDGEGYQAALHAMKEQFPYYVDDVETITAARSEDGERSRDLAGLFRNTEDKGYVKPKYNRPEAARSGYFDESITGKGKGSADQTNYQNWAVRRPNKTESASAESVAAGEATKTPAAGGKPTIQQMGEERRKRVVADEELENLKVAVKDDAKAWGEANEIYLADPNNTQKETLFNVGDHPHMWDFHKLDADEKAAYLNNPENVKGMYEDSKKLFTKYEGKLRASNQDVNRFKTAHKVAERYSTPLWNDAKLTERTAGKVQRLTNEAYTEAANHPGVKAYLIDDEITLVAESNKQRENVHQAKIDGDTERANTAQEAVRRIELARAVKAHRNQYANPQATPTQATTPAETVVQTTPAQTQPETKQLTQGEPVKLSRDQAITYLETNLKTINNLVADPEAKKRAMIDLMNDKFIEASDLTPSEMMQTINRIVGRGSQ